MVELSGSRGQVVGKNLDPMMEVGGQASGFRVIDRPLALGMEFPPPSVLAHVVDVHCHPTDTDIPDAFPEDLRITICAMSARTRDQPLVRELTTKCPEKVIPAFGVFISPLFQLLSFGMLMGIR